ncbi:MAG TPA: helix-turn-helix domain-containing protein [Lacunisphaera sp.]|jgi:hypothetical protein
MKNMTSDTNDIRVLLSGMTLSQKKEFLSKMAEETNKVTQIDDRRTTFLNQLNEWGYTSPTDFLIECEFIPNPLVKKSRVKITDDVRQNVVTDLKSGVSTKEISIKYGITEDSVYNIKGKCGLTKPRTKTVQTPSVTVPIPTESVTPSNVSPMVESPELKKEVA